MRRALVRFAYKSKICIRAKLRFAREGYGMQICDLHVVQSFALQEDLFAKAKLFDLLNLITTYTYYTTHIDTQYLARASWFKCKTKPCASSEVPQIIDIHDANLLANFRFALASLHRK